MKNILFAILMLLIASCKSDDGGDLTYVAMDSTLLGKGNIVDTGNGFMTQQKTVINSQSDWDSFLNALANVQDVTTLLNSTAVDFNNETAIVVIDETRENGVYEILLSVTKNSQNIKVGVITQQMNIAGGTGTTQPYHIIKVDNSSNLDVIFE